MKYPTSPTVIHRRMIGSGLLHRYSTDRKAVQQWNRQIPKDCLDRSKIFVKSKKKRKDSIPKWELPLGVYWVENKTSCVIRFLTPLTMRDLFSQHTGVNNDFNQNMIWGRFLYRFLHMLNIDLLLFSWMSFLNQLARRQMSVTVAIPFQTRLLLLLEILSATRHFRIEIQRVKRVPVNRSQLFHFLEIESHVIQFTFYEENSNTRFSSPHFLII
jgi:hypothetical protein